MSMFRHLETVPPCSAMPRSQVFSVVHPLEDSPEAKRDIDDPPERLVGKGKWALVALRGYLVMLALLVGSRLFIH